MYLEKLEINGFKSFAQKVTLEFKPGIAAIVGPNGSGKSNIADAIRWVLGEQSLKMLRGKKSEDVIFSGSDKKARLGLAEVSLSFNNERDEVGLGLSEIRLTRRLYRDGESEYLINQQKSRLLDIQMLLARSGVANTSYAIIGQGMIDAFLLASREERKEFFEEASGVKTLQIKRDQTLNKLRHTEENLTTASLQLSEITPRLNSLTRQVKRLARRVETETKLKNLQVQYFGALWHEVNQNYEQQRTALKKTAEEQEKIEQKVKAWQNEMAQLTRDSAQSEIMAQLNKNYQRRLQEKMELNEKIATIKIKMAQLTTTTTKHEKNIPPASAREIIASLKLLKSLNEKIKEKAASQNWPAVEQLLNEQTQILTDLDQKLAPFESLAKTAPQEMSEAEQKIAAGQKQLKAADEEIARLQNEIKKEATKEKLERSRIWELQEKYQQEQNALNQISAQVNNLRVEIARWETKKDDLEAEIRQALGGLVWLTEQGAQKILTENRKRELVTEIGQLKHQLELIGGIDPEVQREYEETKVRHEFLSGQLADLKKSFAALEQLLLELDENIRRQFENKFTVINEEFQKYFKILFGGGKAKLTLIKAEKIDELAKETDGEAEAQELPLAPTLKEKTEMEKIEDRLNVNTYAGVEIEATPPGKKLKSINMLSGGERALTSIALICAIISANPSPFVVLDEVDAALDEANSIRYAEILEELTHRSQFIVITHNRATMEKADILYGVTMSDDGVSALLSLKLESAEKYTNR